MSDNNGSARSRYRDYDKRMVAEIRRGPSLRYHQLQEFRLHLKCIDESTDRKRSGSGTTYLTGLAGQSNATLSSCWSCHALACSTSLLVPRCVYICETNLQC